MAEGEGVLIPIEAKDELSGALAKMAEAAGAFMSSMEKVNETLKKTEDATDKAEKKTSTFVSALQRIKGAGDLINGLKIRDLISGFEQMSVAGIAVGASIITGTKSAMSMEHQLALVGLSSKVTTEELKQLKNMTFDLANASQTSANQLAMVGGRLLKDGKSIEELFPIMKSMTMLVGTFGGDFVESFKQISGVTKAFGMDLNTIPRTLDNVARVASETNTEYTELLSALQATAPHAKTAGLSMEELISIYGTFKAAGLTSSQAIHSLVASMRIAAGSYKEVMEVVGKAYKNASTETERATLLTQTFKRAGASLGPVFNQVGGDFDGMTKKFANSSGALAKASEAVEQTAQDRMEALHNKLTTSQQIVADKYLPTVGTLSKWLSAIPPEAMVATTTLGHMAAVAFGLAATILSMVSNWGKFALAFPAIAEALVPLTTLMGTLAASAGAFAISVAVWVVLPLLVGAVAFGLARWVLSFEKSDGFIHSMLQGLREIESLGMEHVIDANNNRLGRRASASSVDDKALVGAGMSRSNIQALTHTVLAEKGVTTDDRVMVKELIQQVKDSGVRIDNAHFALHGVQDVQHLQMELQRVLQNVRKTNATTPQSKTSR